ncbi:g10079 [Coccomyxa elongata]
MFHPGLAGDDNSNDIQGSRKRSGSGASQVEETLTSVERTANSLLKRQKAHQEKNKRAQKRYRERKKALYEDQQKQIEELTAKLQEVQMTKDRLETRCQLLEKVVSIRGDGSTAEASTGPQALAVQAQPVPEYVTATAALLGVIYPGHGLEETLRTDHVERMTVQDYIKVMDDFKGKLVRLMLNTDGSEQCPVRKEIENMIEAQRWATAKMIAHRPERMMRIALEVRSHKISCGEHKPDPDLARRVLAAMDLTPDQKARIVENRRRLLISLEMLLRRQNSAVEVLQTSMPLEYNDMSASMAFLRAALAAQEVSEGLKNNHGVVRDFMRELLCGVLTLWQEAKAVVEAWPTYPDALAVSNLVAEELGDESANARLLLLKQAPAAAALEASTPRQSVMLQLIHG